MSKFFPSRSCTQTQRTLPSARYLLEWAAFLTLLFLVVQLAGLREFTSVLNGTIGSTHLSWQTAAFLGAAYIFIYLGFILFVPILILAALILKLWQRVVATKGIASESGAKTEMD